MSIDAQSPPHAGSGTGPSTVSSSGIEAIETSLDHVEPLLQISEAIETVYDVESTAAELLRGGWTRVCLQFPDELLHDSVPVFKAVRARLPDAVEVYVMADTTYGSCCVDEVAAQHVDAQVVVHYGHACLSAPSRLPVLYVFPKAPIDAEHAAIALVDQLQDGTNTAALSGRSTLLLLSDVAYSWKLEEIYARLCDTLQEKWTIVRSETDTKAYLAEPSSRVASHTSRSAADAATTAFSTEGGAQVPSSCCSPVNAIQPAGGCCSAAGETASSGCCQSGTSASSPLRPSAAATSTGPQNTSQRKASCRSYTLPPGTSLESDTVILYVGPESLAMTNLLLSNASTPVVSYLPDTKTSSGKGTARLESGRTNKLLMRRYGTIARARDADVYGIVVGTLGVSSYLPTLAYLRKLLKKHQKKSYTMAVGKLTPAKLGNFLEVETWVLVACGENSLVEAHKEFLKPIITPWELEVALGEREWLAASEVDGGTGERKQGYTLDFTDVLGSAAQEADSAPASGADALQGDLAPGGDGQEADSGEVFGDDPDGPIFSTATGTYRYRRTYGDAKADVQSAAQLSAAAGQLSLRNNQSALASVLSSAGGEHLAGRTYRGLDPRFGQDAASAVEQGRSGVAREYGGDREAQGVDAEERE